MSTAAADMSDTDEPLHDKIAPTALAEAISVAERFCRASGSRMMGLRIRFGVWRSWLDCWSQGDGGSGSVKS